MADTQEITEGQAPGHLSDEQAHFWAMGWNAHDEALRDDYDELKEILHDLVQDECEKRAIGGGPGWKERHEKSWARAFEVFEP